MPESYTTIKGDTLTQVSTKFYGDGNQYKKILDANPAINDPNVIIAGTVLTIPDSQSAPPEPSEIDVDPDTLIGGISEEVAIVIDGISFKFWTEATITRSFDSIADTFSLSAPWFPDNETYREIFKPFSYTSATIYIGGTKILTGFIVTVNTSTAGNARVITIEGYSYAGVIADVNISASSWPAAIDGLDLQQIAEKIVAPFAINIIFDYDPGPAFSKNEKQVIEPDEKIADYLIKLGRQRGFVIGSNADGDLLFRKTTTEPATVSIFEGEFPFLSSSATYNGQNRYSDITAIGTETKSGAGQIATISDPELKKNGVTRPFVFKATDTNSGGLQSAATAQLGRQIADSVQVDLTLKGFHDPETTLWEDNVKIIYKSDGDMIYQETEFLVRDVKFNKSPEGATTNLRLVFPESYSGEIKGEFPWG